MSATGVNATEYRRLVGKLAQLQAERDRERARADQVEKDLAESECCRDSLRLERDGLEHVRLRDNQYLLDRVKAAEARAVRAEQEREQQSRRTLGENLKWAEKLQASERVRFRLEQALQEPSDETIEEAAQTLNDEWAANPTFGAFWAKLEDTERERWREAVWIVLRVVARRALEDAR